MRDPATPTRDAPLRRLAFLGLVFVATILSCAKDVTGPNSGRFMRGFSWNPVFPPAMRSVGVSSGVVDFNRVHVVLHHSDGTVALDTTIAFPSTADSLTVSLTVKLLSDAPASGEPMTLDLGYVNAAGDTVFKGGPLALTAAPAPAAGGVNPPVQIPVAYTGPGASAISVVIAPRSATVAAGAPFTFTAIAKDAGGNALAGTPVIWTSLDPTIATITAPAAGAGVAGNLRGTARILAQLLTGAMDTVQVIVTLPASQIAKPASASGDAQTGTAGTPLAQPISVKVAASDGVGVAGTTVTFAVATGGGSVSPTSVVSDANGLATTAWTLGTSAGAQSITAAAATLTGSPLTYTATATAAAATKLVVTTQPLNASGGAVMPAIVVSAEDANGNVATGFTGAVTMALGTTTSGATLGGTLTVNAVAGVATFPTLTINKAFAGYTLVAGATGLTAATSAAFNITVGLATSIASAGGNTQTGTVGEALPTPIAVRVSDAGGNGVTGKTVTFATTNGLLSSTSVVTDANGLAVTIWTLGSTVGAQSMTATVAGLANSPLTFTATGTSVVASKLVFTTVPVTATGGIPLPVVVVTAEDASGNAATTFTGAITMALGATTSGATLSGTLSVNAVAGVATFSALTIDKAFAGYTLVAAATGPTSATSPTFAVTVGSATTLVAVGGTGQTGTISIALPTPIAVRVTDAGGNGVSGKTVTFATADGAVSPTSAVSDASGLAVTTWTLGARVSPPSDSMTATAAGLTNSPLTITATGTAVVAGAATQLTFTTQPSSVASLAANSIVVHALDVNNLLATSFTGNVTLAIGNNPGTSTLGGTVTVAAVAGVATFSNITLNKVGTGYTLVASASALTSATSSAFSITPGAAANLAIISAGNGQTAMVGTAVPTAPGVTVTDASGNPVSGTTVTFTVAGGGGSVSPANGVVSTNASGQAFVTSWTLGATAGAQTLVATSAGLAGSPATFAATAQAGSATKLVFTAPPATTSAVATLAAVVVSAEDANGNVVPTFTGAVTLAFGITTSGAALGGTLTVNAVAGLATFSTLVISKAFTGYTLVASGGTLASATSGAFNIITGPATTMAAVGGTGQSGTASGALPTPIAIRVSDAAGNGVAGTTVTFATTNGSLSPTGATVTDANGLTVTIWTLGATAGAQSMTATSTGLANSPLTITATSMIPGLRTWTGVTSNDWGTATNWSPAGVPLTTDSAVVPSAGILPTITSATGAVTVKALTLAPSAQLTLTSAVLTVTSSLDATGGIVGSGGIVVLTSATGATLKGTLTSQMQVTGVYTVAGPLAANSLQILNSGSVDVNGQAVAIGASGVSTANTATIKMTTAGGTLVSAGGASFTGGSETGKLTTGTLSVASNFTEGGNGGAADSFNAGPGFTTIMNGTVATNFTFNDPNTSAFGALIINDALGVTALSQFQVTDLTLTAGVLSGSTGATIYGTLTDPLTHWAAGNISFASSTTPVSASTPAITPAAQITFNNNPSVLAGDLTVNGTVNVQGNLVVNGHMLTVSGVNNSFATSATGQLTMTNPADVVNVAGNVTFASDVVGGPMTAGTLAVGGNFTQSGTSPQSITTGGTNTILLNGAGNQTVSFSSPDGNFTGGTCVGDACVQNLTVNKPSGILGFITTVKVQGDFVNNSTGGTLHTPVNFGPFIVAGNATFGQGGMFYHVGVGGTTFSKGAGTTIDSVTYFGGAQPYNPATLGEFYSDIRGTANWTSQGTLAGEMVVDGSGQLNVATGGAVVTGNFSTVSFGTLRMATNPTDVLAIGGVATFNGGTTQGLLTAGSVVINGPAINVKGQAYDEIGGTHSTIVNGVSGTQTLSWTSPVAGHGYNNLTMQGASFKQFSGDQYITGTLLFDATMVGPGNVQSSNNIHVNTLIDNSSGISGGAFQGSTALHITGTTPFNRDTLVVNTLYIDHGQTFALAHNLVTHYVVVDSNSTLSLNGHTANLQSDYFTTQNGGALVMQSANDSLIANQLYFNGGSTVGALTNGVIDVAGSVFGVLYQGYSAGHIAVPSASPTAFAASGTQVRFNAPFSSEVAFANPGTGNAGSHFGFVQAQNGNPVTLQSNVFVDSLLLGESGALWQSDSAGLDIVRTITTNGINNSGQFSLGLNAVNVVLNDGPAASTLFNNITWTNFPANYSGVLFTQNRSVFAGPSLGSNNYSTLSFGTGFFVQNLGSFNLTLGSGNTGLVCNLLSLTNLVGTCK